MAALAVDIEMNERSKKNREIFRRLILHKLVFLDKKKNKRKKEKK